jgi:curved DNA-binding protein CbpA
VLGVSAGATPEEIKSAYRAAVKSYHPDLVAGLGRKLRLVAAEEIKRINLAYAEARAQLTLQ